MTSGTRPAPNAEVVLFPDEPSLWAFPARHVRVLKSDAQGMIRVRGMPPHQAYLAVALDYLDDGETQDPEFLEVAPGPGHAVFHRFWRVPRRRSPAGPTTLAPGPEPGSDNFVDEIHRSHKDGLVETCFISARFD